MLDDVRAHFARYIAVMDDTDLDVLTLWAASTYLCMETYTTPRLLIDSPVPESGKTTVLEHLERLCYHPVQMASLTSPALLTRMLDTGMRTILVDEADRALNPDKEGVSELLAVFNSGYKRGGTRPVLVQGKGGEWLVKEMSTFSPVAMAGNNPNLPDDTRSRTIRVLLMPDVDGSVEESDWELIDSDVRALGKQLQDWADSVRDAVRTSRPPLPEGVIGRGRERWSPLMRVAKHSGSVTDIEGGEWVKKVDILAVMDMQRVQHERDDGLTQQRPGVLLLKHLHEYWSNTDADFVATEVLIPWLISRSPNDWGKFSTFGKDLTPQRMGRMLSTSYGVTSTRLGGEGPRGYTRGQFNQIWHRMRTAPPPPVQGDPPPGGTG